MGDIKTVMPGVTVRVGARGKTVRLACMVAGVRYSKTCELPVELLLTERGQPTRELRSEYGRWVAECQAKSGHKKSIGLRVPTIRELIDTYSNIAWQRQADPRFRKADRTIETAIKNFGYCLEASGLRDNRPYTALMDYDVIRRIANRFVSDCKAGGRGLTSTSAWSYLTALQSVTAKWTVVEYRDRGYKVEPQIIPKQSLFGSAADPKQYEELPQETVGKIWKWYLEITQGGQKSAAIGEGWNGRGDTPARASASRTACGWGIRPPEPTGEDWNGRGGKPPEPPSKEGQQGKGPPEPPGREGQQERRNSQAFYAICMLELAIRPSDIALLTAENFPLAPNGHHRLVYRPHKTRESSNRRVDIEIPDALYERLRALKPEEFGDDWNGRGDRPPEPPSQGEGGNAGGRFITNLRGVEAAVNASLREKCGLNGNKASYELRKLCIHTILVTPVEQGGGIDQAVRLSGDRRETIEKYYCDPYKSHTALPTDAFAAFAASMGVA